jgi:hypothetical protein
MSASRTLVTLLAVSALLTVASCEGKSMGEGKKATGEPQAASSSPAPAPANSSPAPAPVAGPKLVSGFESGLSTPFGTDWRAIDDTQGGGKSSSKIEIVAGGANATKKALKASGAVTVKDYPFPFAGIGLPLGKVVDHVPTPSDLSAYTGIQFWVKGDGKRYMLRAMSTDVQDFNFFHFVFTAGPEWTLISVPFTSLVQFDWGEKVEWTGKSVPALLFTNYSAPGEDFGGFTLYLDEISFI